MSAMKSLVKGFSNKVCLLFSVLFVFKGRKEGRKSRREKKEKLGRTLEAGLGSFIFSNFQRASQGFHRWQERG